MWPVTPDQQARRRGGQQHPDQPLAPGDRRARRRWSARARRLARAPVQRRQAREAEREDAVGDRPGHGLDRQAQRRLDDHRIGHQRDQAAEVAGGIEAVDVLAAGRDQAEPGAPGLQQRRGRRQHRERRADAERQHPQQPEGRRVGPGRAERARRPAAAGSGRRAASTTTCTAIWRRIEPIRCRKWA